MSARNSDDLAQDLARLASSLEALAIPGSPHDLDRLESRRDWVIRTIRDYLIPRVIDPSTPLTVVFAGPTGAGKSTLLNSVAGAEHSQAGPLRPTTETPLALASKNRAGQYLRLGGVRCEVVTGRAPILNELTLVDTPDIDSTSTRHRAIAETMIDNADIVVFVSSAMRYADLVPWEVLRRAASRSVPVIHVLNRVHKDSSGAIADYSARLAAQGLGDGVLAVHEHHLRPGAQTIPRAAVQDLRDRLVGLVEERRAGATDSFRRVLDSVLDETRDLTAIVASLCSAVEETTTRISRELGVDLDKVQRGLRPFGIESLDLEPLAALATRRLRTRGSVSRRLPDPSRVAAARKILEASLVFAVDADIVRRVDGYPLPGGMSLSEVATHAHASTNAGVTAWRADVEATDLVSRSPAPELTSLLLQRACLGLGDDDVSQGALTALSGRAWSQEIVPMLRAKLIRHLTPAYVSVERRMVAGAAGVSSIRAGVEKVRSAIPEVVARSSFANA